MSQQSRLSCNAFKLGLLGAFSLAQIAFGSTIAVIDSGVDFKHPMLQNHAWVNANEIAGNNTDDDQNGYVDDINGWNIIENNNKLLDYKYVGTFSPDMKRFFEIQKKMLEGSAAAEEIAWLKKNVEDKKFIKQLMKFGNFVHGTHVAGISASKSDAAHILGVKLIPTESPFGFDSSLMSNLEAAPSDEIKETILKVLISQFANFQMQIFTDISKYIGGEKSDVANLSLGTNTVALQPLLKGVLRIAFGRDASAEELDTWSKFLVNSMVESGRNFVGQSPETLFVFAAGNDGKNNDEFPVSPANIKSTNTLTVAATQGQAKIARFSNFGVKHVDVAAPGVGIQSAMPGGDTLYLSGTSQAAPFVSGVAGKIKDTNSDLSAQEIRRIIMETVDKKDWLADKVLSGGIVNAERAAAAAKMSISISLTLAIAQAKLDVADVPTLLSDFNFNDENIFVLPLASFLK